MATSRRAGNRATSIGAVGLVGTGCCVDQDTRWKRRLNPFDEAAVIAAKILSRFAGNFLTKTADTLGGDPTELTAMKRFTERTRGEEGTTTRVPACTCGPPADRARYPPACARAPHPTLSRRSRASADTPNARGTPPHLLLLSQPTDATGRSLPRTSSPSRNARTPF